MADNIIDLADYAGGEEKSSAPLPILTLEQLGEQSGSVSWLVKRTIPADALGIMFGGSGTFKSFIAIDLALHVAHGLPWLGKKTKKGSVLFIAAEGGIGLWKRVKAWHIERGMRWQGLPFYVLPLPVNLAVDAPRVQQDTAALGITPDLVVVDTLSQTFADEENSAAEVANYLRELGLWFRQTWQATVLVIHHTGHAATERPRGSSVIKSNPDFSFGVFRDETQMMATVECTKQKEGELGDPVSFAMKVTDLGVDEDGDPVTTLVATAVAETGQVVKFMAHEASRGRGGRNHLFLELALNGIEEKKLRTLFYESIDGDVEKKRQAYFRARKWATSAGLVEFAEGFCIRMERDT